MAIFKNIKALGTDVTISIVASDHLSAEKEIDKAKEKIAEFEKRFSRFLASSELSKLNSSEGGDIKVSDEMIALLKKAKAMYEKTEGVFDPTVLDVLIEAGYDKSLNFDTKLKLNEKVPNKKIKEDFLNRVKFDELKINEEQKSIYFPKDMKIDFGGIGKGYLADILASDISKTFSDFWISMGGDMFLSGKNDGGANWEVDIQDPLNLEVDIAKIKVVDDTMCVATSGITKRKWISGSVEYNHIIDPKTGSSVPNDILMATVIARSVLEADVLAKTVLILGKEKGIELINKTFGTECVMIDKNKQMIFSKNIEQYLIK